MITNNKNNFKKYRYDYKLHDYVYSTYDFHRRSKCKQCRYNFG